MKKFLIGGKKRPVVWGFGAIERYCDALGGDVELLDEVFTSSGLRQVKLIQTLVHSALVEALPEDSEETISFKQVQAWIDEMPNETLTAILSDFKDSKYLGRTISSYYGLDASTEPEKAQEKDLKKK